MGQVYYMEDYRDRDIEDRPDRLVQRLWDSLVEAAQDAHTWRDLEGLTNVKHLVECLEQVAEYAVSPFKDYQDVILPNGEIVAFVPFDENILDNQ